VPKQIFVHGWLLFGDRKISKSSGNVIEPLELTDIYGIDALRFYTARVTRFGQDGNASADDLHERYERELGNDLGNLLSRTTAMIARYREGRIVPAPWESPFRAELAELAREVPERLDKYDLSGALEAIWIVIRSLNRYVEERAPWQLAKDTTKSEELDRTLYDLADGLRAVAIALAAYLPETAPRILSALGQPKTSPGKGSPTAGRRRRTGSCPPSRCSHGSSSRPPSRDRHPRAPRRVRGAAEGAARPRP
jgi:methionyl-tRNA synthetase